MRSCDLSPSLRGRFLSGGSTREERRVVLEHLLGGCDSCRRELAAGWVTPGRASLAAGDQGETARVEKLASELERRRRDVEREEADAARTLSTFLQHPRDRQWLMIRNSRRVESPAFCMQLLDAAFEAMYDDPRRSLDLSEMALAVAGRLDTVVSPESLRFDLLGRAWRHVGNAQRALGDLAGAEKALHEGRAFLLQGTGDPLEEGQQLLFESSLLRAQRQFERALRLVRRARQLYQEIEDPHLEGLALLSEGSILVVMGRTTDAVERTRMGATRIDPSRDRHLALAAAHNLAWCLQEAGDVGEALRVLESARPSYEELGDRSSLLRLSWLEAKLHYRLGNSMESELRYRAAIDGFAEAELPYEVAAVCLDLSAILSEQGRFSELKKLAGEMLVLFRSLGVEREAIAAWMVFQKAAEAETVTVALIERLAAYYAEVKRQPAARFEPAS